MFAGIDIGGTKCAVVFGEIKDNDVKIADKVKIETPKGEDPYSVLGKLAEIIKNKNRKIDAIGISCGGPLDSNKGVILSPPNLQGWDEVYAVKFFEDMFGVPTFIQNDANACALAEWQFGAARGTKNAVFMTFGTGLGAGLILDGKLYSGTNDNAGEVGHIRLSDYGPVGYGKKGSFEGFCSGNGIAQIGQTLARERWQCGEKAGYCDDIKNIEKITTKDIAEAARNGDETALKVFELCGRKLGMGISVIIDMLNPEVIVIGSVFQRCEDLLRPYMEEVVETEALIHARKVCRVVPAYLTEAIGDYAAIAVAKTGLEKENG
ncbi:MAG: ROK family protein [Clostridia bacterium]|nr:ROK family protein [Clostridia bacterium]